MNADAIQLIVVEPNELLRRGLISVLEESGLWNFAAFETIEEMEAGIGTAARDAVFLVNLGPNETLVKQGINALKSRYPTSPIALLSDKYDHRHMRSAIGAGASGYILSGASSETFVKSVEVVSIGQPIVPQEAIDLMTCRDVEQLSEMSSSQGPPETPVFDLLSDRELLVLRCLSGAMSNKLIARECEISEATVKVHVKAILKKINGKNRTEAAIWAIEHGLEPYEPATPRCGGRIGAKSDKEK